MPAPQTSSPSHSSPEEALAQCGPLSDTVRLGGRFMGWTTYVTLAVQAVALALAASSMVPATSESVTLISVAVGLVLLVVWIIARIFVIQPISLVLHETSAPQDLCLYLRAFRSDASAAIPRAWLKAAMGERWRLSGIRAPAQRASFLTTLFSPLLTGLRSAGSHQFELEAADHNWLARLLASFSGARIVIIDVRDTTPHVMDEIELAAIVFGPPRCLFLVDDRHSPEQWREGIARHLQGGKWQPGQVKLIIWPQFGTPSPSEFTRATQQVLGSVPEGTPSISGAATDFVRQRVAGEHWSTPLKEREGFILAVSLVFTTALGLLMPRDLPALGVGLTVLLCLVVQVLFWRAWGRARFQARVNAIVNPTHLAPARRTRTAGFLMGASVVIMAGLLFVALAAHVAASQFDRVKIRAEQVRMDAFIQQVHRDVHYYYAENNRYPEPVQPHRTAVIDGKTYNVGGALMLYQVVTGDGDDHIKGGNVLALRLGINEWGRDPDFRRRHVAQLPDGRHILVDPRGRPLQYQFNGTESPVITTVK